MSRYHTPRMVNPRLTPQPVVYTTVNTSPYHDPAALGHRRSMGPHYPSPQMFHVATSDPSHSRGRHGSSSRSHRHRRSHSVDRHGGSRHHRHHRRSSTPVRSMPAHYSPGTQYATIPSSRHRRYSVPEHHYPSSSRDPHRASHYDRREHHHHVSHRGESIGRRIMRFFGMGTPKVRFVDPYVTHLR